MRYALKRLWYCLLLLGTNWSISDPRQDFPQVDSISIYKKELIGLPTGSTSCRLLLKIGTLHYNNFQLDSAENYLSKAKKCAAENDLQYLLAQATWHYGNVFYDNGLRSRAIELHHESLVIFQALSDSLWIARTFNVIGNTYNYLGEHERAREYYGNALNIFSRIGEMRYVAFVNENLAIMHGEEGRPEKAVELYLYAEEVLKEIGSEKDLGTTYYNISIQYRVMNEYAKAIEKAQQALNIAKSSGNQSLVGLIYQHIGLIEIKRGHYDDALSFLNRAMEIADETDNEQVRANAVANLVLCYEGMGKYQEALKYSKLSRNLDSLLYNEENAQIINEVETRYQVSQKEQENEILKQTAARNEAELRSQRLITWFVVGGAIILIGFSIILYSGRQSIVRHKNEIEKQANKLKQLDEFKSRFFANISHDIRTPLTLISGYSYQIKNDKDNYLSRKSVTNLSKLEKNSAKLTRMADEIRDLIMLEEGRLNLKYSQVQVKGYIDNLTSLFSSTAEIKRIQLICNLNLDEELVAHLDKSKFEKVLYNLMSNAFRYTLEGGKIVVGVRSSDDRFILEVEDSGEGIDEAYLPYVFDRYYQTPDNQHKEREGQGIGLALVKELTQLHGGEVEVHSRKGEGTTFKLSYPLNLDMKLESGRMNEIEEETMMGDLHVESREPERISISRDEIKKPTILIVDDHNEIREYIRSIIEDDYQVLEAKNGQKALGILAKNRVDLIITDLMMPWLDGFGLIEALNKDNRFNSIPLMVVSARTTEEDRKKVLDQGINDFIAKPFDPDDLRVRISNRLQSNGEGGKNVWDDLLSDQERISELEQNILGKINQLVLHRIGDSKLSVKDIAMEICASERKTYRLIKELTDHTPLDYIKTIRFDYARELLTRQKVRSASEAAKAIGMSNVTQFSRQYKKHFGTDPATI